MEKTVKLADKAGFCFGVNRAVELVYSEIKNENKKVYTYGPIIHNTEVTNELAFKGVKVIKTLEDAQNEMALTDECDGRIMITRSHGITRAEQDALIEMGYEVVDAACPFVKKIHRIVEEYSSKDYFIIVIGSADHPEVEGIVGWAVTDSIAVVNSEEDINNLKIDKDKVCIVSQTTFNQDNYKKLVEIIQKTCYDIIDIVDSGETLRFFNTICSATKERQDAAKDLSAKVDAMIVIGDKSSSNTKKLYEICSSNCDNTYLIQTYQDLLYTDLTGFNNVGITAGASTPNNIIQEVLKYVRNELWTDVRAVHKNY